MVTSKILPLSPTGPGRTTMCHGGSFGRESRSLRRLFQIRRLLQMKMWLLPLHLSRQLRRMFLPPLLLGFNMKINNKLNQMSPRRTQMSLRNQLKRNRGGSFGHKKKSLRKSQRRLFKMRRLFLMMRLLLMMPLSLLSLMMKKIYQQQMLFSLQMKI